MQARVFVVRDQCMGSMILLLVCWVRRCLLLDDEEVLPPLE